MPLVLTEAAQATPEWLTLTLREHGTLGRGHVTSIQQRSYASKSASVAHLQVSYSADAPPSAPTQLFLKLGRRGIEVEFYTHVAPTMGEAPLPRC